MIRYYKRENKQLVQLKAPEKGCWINVYPPFDQASLKHLGEQYNLPFDYLLDSLDIDERPRFERDDDIDLIVLKTPIANDIVTDIDALYITIPIGIILAKDVIVTISPYENQVIDSFLNSKVKALDPANRSMFVLKLFDRNIFQYLFYLNEINSKRNLFETELYNSMRNKELIRLLNIEKSLVYFVTALRADELMMLKIQRTNFLKTVDDEAESDLLQDVLVDSAQAYEMAQVYTNILSGTMDAFASIISNNLNQVMKLLTSVTIVLMVPTLVASFYGMNVSLPFAKEPWAFSFTLLVSVILSTILVYVFFKKRWF